METNLNNEFFVILPSDSNLDMHSDNVNNKFKVEFDTPIKLSEDYECAVWDINIPHFIPQLRSFNIKISYIKPFMTDDDLIWNFNDNLLMTLTYHPPKNLSFEQFLYGFSKFINNNVRISKKNFMEKLYKKNELSQISDRLFIYKNPSMEYSEYWDRFEKDSQLKIQYGYLKSVRMHSMIFRVVFLFDENIYQLLRVPKQFRYPNIIRKKNPDIYEGQSIYDTSHYICKYSPENITEDFKGNWFDVPKAIRTEYCILILTDIVGESHINESKKPIIKMLFSNQSGKVENISKSVQYFPVNKKEIKFIDIKIVDLDGDLILFKNGPVNIVLNFRRK